MKLFEDLPSTNTPITAENLNQIQDNLVVVSATEPTGDKREKVWIQKGKNLIKQIYKGSYYNSTSTSIVKDVEFSRTDFIKIKPNKQYIFSNSVNMRFGWVNVFDENHNFLQQINYDDLLKPFTITNEKAKYILISLFTRDYPNMDWVQLEHGSIATEYESYTEPKIFVKNDNNVYEEFISKEDLPTFKKIEASEFFTNTSYNIYEFECYQYGNLINIQRMVINGVKGIAQNTKIATVNPKYVPIGGKPVRLLGCSGEAILDYVCYLSPDGITLIHKTVNDITSENCYLFNTTYATNY